MYHTGGEKGCCPMLWNDSDKLAPGGMRGEDTGTSYLKSVFCPERQFCPPDLWQPGFLAQIIPALSQHWWRSSARFSALSYFITNLSPLVPVLNRCN